MAKYRKKPVVIEAVCFTGQPSAELPDWVNRAASWQDRSDSIFIKTLEGTHEGRIGDWLIKGVKGEVYPCKPDIFAATYEGPIE